MISGEDARTMLDRDAGAMLAARHPGLLVGPARCPFLMNLTGGKVGTCTISVAGETMRVGVTSDAYMHAFFFPHDRSRRNSQARTGTTSPSASKTIHRHRWSRLNPHRDL
jgi:hypothetical protein